MTPNDSPARPPLRFTTAVYTPSQVRRHAGNPFIEAQPEVPPTASKFASSLQHYPLLPTAADRKKGDTYRTMELPVISDIVYPFPEFAKAGMAMATLLREPYVARHPMRELDHQRRYAIASGERLGSERFPADWKSSASGHIIIAPSGMGKTTFVDTFLLGQNQVIRHASYKDAPLNCFQITYIKLRIPFDGTLKMLCVSFFVEVDRRLGTPYAKQARAARTITAMVQLMNEVATAVSLGLLVIDELQNLKVARGDQAQFVLNLFIEIIESLGIGLVTLATPAVETVLSKSVRNTRKILTLGQTTLPLMGKRDPHWKLFCEKLWEYTFTKKFGSLTPPIMNAWHRCSAGNTAFASVAFRLAQQNAIGDNEYVDEDSFAEVLETDFAFLKPAIDALNSGDPNKIAAFDDLMFSKEFDALIRSMGVNVKQELPSGTPKVVGAPDSEANGEEAGEEFDEVSEAGAAAVEEATAKAKPKKSGKRADAAIGRAALMAADLPSEDPLN